MPQGAAHAVRFAYKPFDRAAFRGDLGGVGIKSVSFSAHRRTAGVRFDQSFQIVDKTGVFSRFFYARRRGVFASR
jgi:hypothetical protein